MKTGELFIVTTGEYSDYGIRGVFRCAVDFDLDAELASWMELKSDQRNKYRFETHEFLVDLETRGLMVEESLLEVHVSDYCTACEAPEKEAREQLSRIREWRAKISENK